MKHSHLVRLAADMVSRRPEISSIGEMQDALIAVFGTLSDLGKRPVKGPPPVPAVSIEDSVKPDAVTCLECGKSMKMLKRHLHTEHGISPNEYRERWGLHADHLVTAPDYSEVRAGLAKNIGLGHHPGSHRKSVTPSHP